MINKKTTNERPEGGQETKNDLEFYESQMVTVTGDPGPKFLPSSA
jgi:hypothetical protein